MRILIVEDDRVIAELLTKALTAQHYVVDVAGDGEAGWERAESLNYDAILLDVMLPKLDGISICQRLRSQGNQTPILLLTAQDTTTHKVMGLDAGADDYVVKPFNLQELLARIRALLRRAGSALPPLLQWRNLQLNPSTCEVTCGGQPFHLTPKEYALLELFLRNCHRIFSCGVLIDHLWSLEEPPSEDTVRSHIKGLRQKLKSVGVLEDPIETVYGMGYRLKAEEQGDGEVYKPEKLDQKQHETSKTTKNQPPELSRQMAAGVARIWQQVSESLSQRVAVLEQATTMLFQEALSNELRQQAEQEAHKLAGTLGMFGSDRGSCLAREVELLLETGVRLEPDQTQHLGELVRALRQELQRLNTTENTNLPSATEPVDERPWLLIVDQDRSLAEALATQAGYWGMRSQIASDPIAARECLSRNSPDVVVLDFSCANTLASAMALLTQLNGFTPPVPVIVLIAGDSLIDRVKVVRLGGHAVLHKPFGYAQGQSLSPDLVLEAVTQALEHSGTIEATVMIVDDDPVALTAIQRLLVPWGIKVSTLDNPLRFWETLAAVSPDLLVLDVEMPYIRGIELCQVVRNDPNWSGLPILFLTAHTDTQTLHQVFTAGADDCVSKPIVGPELVTRILNRLERSRLLRSLAETDALTGVANRRQVTQKLTQLIEMSDRLHQPLCFAIVAVDHMKLINRQYGYAAGDQALSQLGRLLRQTFSGKDAVGRLGGIEFVVGMAGMTKSDGVQRLSELLNKLHQIEFRDPNSTTFRVTCSVGVVEYPQDGANLQALYRAAEETLQGMGNRE